MIYNIKGIIKKIQAESFVLRKRCYGKGKYTDYHRKQDM